MLYPKLIPRKSIFSVAQIYLNILSFKANCWPSWTLYTESFFSVPLCSYVISCLAFFISSNCYLSLSPFFPWNTRTHMHTHFTAVTSLSLFSSLHILPLSDNKDPLLKTIVRRKKSNVCYHTLIRFPWWLWCQKCLMIISRTNNYFTIIMAVYEESWGDWQNKIKLV